MIFARSGFPLAIAHPEHDFRRQSAHVLVQDAAHIGGVYCSLHTACLCAGTPMQVSLWTTTSGTIPVVEPLPLAPPSMLGCHFLQSRDAAASPPGKQAATSSRSPFQHSLHASHLPRLRQPAEIPKPRVLLLA